MDRELDQTLQRNLERLYNYLENPEREEAQRVLLAAEPEPIRITHGIPDLYTDWLSSPSYQPWPEGAGTARKYRAAPATTSIFSASALIDSRMATSPRWWRVIQGGGDIFRHQFSLRLLRQHLALR